LQDTKIGSELIGKTKKKININWRDSGHASMGKVYDMKNT